MRKLPLIVFLVLIIAMSSVSQSTAAVNHLYREKIDAYSRLDGETLRWNLKREFAIDNYDLVPRTNNSTPLYMRYDINNESTNGLYHTETQKLDKTNFFANYEFRTDGRLKVIDWKVKLFRLNSSCCEPFPIDLRDVLTDSTYNNQRYDLILEADHFSIALEYYEFHVIDGNVQKVRVNTELVTDNYNDGRVYRTALNIVKRDSNGDILFKYKHDIKEVTKLGRTINLLDQPLLWVPLDLAAVFLVIYIYIRIVRYWKENNYRIIKEEPSPEESDQSQADTKNS